jgi:hypothetical protein
MARPQADRDSQNVGLAVTELCGQAFPPNARFVLHVRDDPRVPSDLGQLAVGITGARFMSCWNKTPA